MAAQPLPVEFLGETEPLLPPLATRSAVGRCEGPGLLKGQTMRITRFVALILFLAAFTAGCSTDKRPVQTEEALLAARAQAARRQEEMFFAAVERVVDRVAARSRGKTEPAVVNLLAISGGGDYGAFGAGFLVGWGQSTDATYRRPEFDVVTGVSTGALLAPFAFLGTDESCKLVEKFYRNPKKDWVLSRGLLFFLPSNPSFMTVDGLERELKAAVDDAMVKQIAAEGAKGRLLLVSATDLDQAEQRVWNLGEEAARGGGDPDRVRRILMASAAIPAIFPPVELDGSSYADGGVSANILLRLDPKTPAGFLKVWQRKYPELPLPKVRYWIIVNNQMRQPPKTVQPKWPAVVGPSLATAIRSATIAEVRWLAAQAHYSNAAYGTDIEVRVVAIPDEWRAPVPGDFQKETMESLTDIGRKMGGEPSSWQVWASPEDARPTTRPASRPR